MFLRSSLSLMLLLSAGAPSLLGQAAPQALATREVRSYALKGKPSEVVRDLAAMKVLAGQFEQDARADLAVCPLGEQGIRQGLYSALYYTALVREDWAGAQQHLAAVRALRSQPLQKRMTGLLVVPLLEAKTQGGTYRAHLERRLGDLPKAEVAFPLKAILDVQQATTHASLIAGVAESCDPKFQGGLLGEQEAGTLLVAATNLHLLLPVKAEIVHVLEKSLTSQPVLKAQLLSPVIRARGAYFGQSLPGETPASFAPEVLAAISPWVGSVAFSPDGLECFLDAGDANYGCSTLYHSVCWEGVWSPLVEAPFTRDIPFAGEPVFSTDGRTLAFTGRKGGSTDFFRVERTAQGWGEAVPLPMPINSEKDEFRYCPAADGSITFASNRGAGQAQIHRAVRKGDGWTVEKLPAPVNALALDGDPCFGPDGRWLVFYSARPGGLGRVDLCISFPEGKGGWSEPRYLGPDYNTPGDDFGAALTAGGKAMFFIQHGEKRNVLMWVATSVLDRMKRKV